MVLNFLCQYSPQNSLRWHSLFLLYLRSFLIIGISNGSRGKTRFSGYLSIARRFIRGATERVSIDTSKLDTRRLRCRDRGEEPAATKESCNGEIGRMKRPLLYRWRRRWAKFMA